MRETLDRERSARHRWERASAHPSSAVEHDTVSALRDSGPTGPEFQREGLDLALAASTSVRLTLTAIRDGCEGVRGGPTVTR